jgi:hypothetical protein
MNSDITCDEILERFPGPVTLYEDPLRRIKLLLGIAFCSLFVIGSAWAGNYRGWEDWRPSFGVFFFGFCGIGSGIMMFVPAFSLVLDADGFESTVLYRHIRRRWQDVSDFKAIYLTRQPWTKFVTYNDDRRGKSVWSRRMLVDYELRANDLARLMNQWRDLSIATCQAAQARNRRR